MDVFSAIFGASGAIETVLKSLSNLFNDIWCVAIFTLVDIATPYVRQALSGTGLLEGIGGTIFSNMQLILKLGICEEWKSKLGAMLMKN